MAKYVVEEKKDGFSYICDGGRFFSRKLSEAKGSEGMPIEKTDHVPHLADALRAIAEVCDADIHGELYKPGGTSDDVTKIMGCLEDNAVFKQTDNAQKLHYMIHDIRRWYGKDTTKLPWIVRRSLLWVYYDRFISGTPLDQYVHLSELLPDALTSFHKIVSSGGEGIMIKDTMGIYIPGKKPANNWIKCKKEVTLDAVIMGFNNGGSGKNADLFKSIQVGLWDGTGLVHIGDIHSGISDELRKRMHEDRSSYVGRVVEVDAMEFNGKSWSMRHGRLVRFRDDKTKYECTTDGLRIKDTIL
jgi:ATP-dependent DNA ligase